MGAFSLARGFSHCINRFSSEMGEKSRVWRWWWPWGHGVKETEDNNSTEGEAATTVKIEVFDVLPAVNTATHKTALYAGDQVVLRRGGKFHVRFTLNQEFDKTKHVLNVEFRRGTTPDFQRGTRFECVVGPRAVREWEWWGSVEGTEGNTVDVVVNIPVNTPVGEYEVIAEAVDKASKKQDSLTADQKVAILFNPWDKEDEVYLTNEDERSEYVLNTSGSIWRGTYNNFFAGNWQFDQFESYSLNTALYLLDQSGLESELRRSPVHVSRTLTTMVNANDNDGGVLVGNWSGYYSGGVSPYAWGRSGAILSRYWKSHKSVRWAQCWVFGGVLTSVLRSLGIPARPVTNFESAHDTDASRSIDKVFLDGQLVYNEGRIWNFHVWVEAWMERPDLKGHYGGWQAVDATPQEPSPHSGVFTLGPAPVAAIKEGRDVRYDTEFVISEVNADIVTYVRTPSGDRLASSNHTKVGKKMSTKAVGGTDRVDITSQYKHPEGSPEERAALGRDDTAAAKSDVGVNIETATDVVIGEELRAELVLTSTASAPRTAGYTIHLSPVTYIGALGAIMATIRDSTVVEPGVTLRIPITLPPSEYIGKVQDQLMVNISAFVTVKETDSVFVDKETFRFKTPDITLSVKDGRSSLAVGSTATVKAAFTNPLAIPLTHVTWFIEGAALLQPTSHPGSPVPAGGEASTTFTISPKNALEPVRSLTVTFESNQLEGVMGHTQVQVVA